MASGNIGAVHPQADQSLSSTSSRVAILLTTFNGERFLAEQLDSIAAQSHRDWVVHASDDGSTDGTLEILLRYQANWGADRLQIHRGPGLGFAKNFMSLVRHPEIDAPWLAFCDQDDVWFPDKLERALAALAGAGEGEPALFCSRTRLIEINGRVIGYSPLFRKAPSFRNALVQSIAGANTMLLNRAAWRLMAGVPQDLTVVSHDWLAYLLVAGHDGLVIYHSKPTLDYRQHGNNLVGSNSSWRDRLERLSRMWRGTFRQWNDDNLAALAGVRRSLPAANAQAMARFEEARRSWCLKRIRLLRQSGVYRQTALGSLGLVLAAVLGRV